MPDFTDSAAQPDYGAIESGNKQAVSDAIALIWGLVQSLITAERPSFLIDASRIVGLNDSGMFKACFIDNISFGSTEISHSINISALGCQALEEIFFMMLGPGTLQTTGATVAAGYYQLWLSKPSSLTSLTLNRTSVDGDGSSSNFRDVDLPASTHTFFVGRINIQP